MAVLRILKAHPRAGAGERRAIEAVERYAVARINYSWRGSLEPLRAAEVDSELADAEAELRALLEKTP